MKISDIFRQVADAIDQQEDPGHPDDLIQNPATLDPVYSATGVSNTVAGSQIVCSERLES
jgi:hypothetical protein